ncbi:MAG TPA: hypothetical protein VML96_05510 [Egibacteraceae bacterium]|nr:hypothetical protein [Egibacteraceae bacterium]
MRHSGTPNPDPLRAAEVSQESPARLVAPLAAPHDGHVIGPHPVARALAGLAAGAVAGVLAVVLTPRERRRPTPPAG